MHFFRCNYKVAKIWQILLTAACGAVVLACLQCTKPQPKTSLPTDVLGVAVGMTKEEAEKQLKETATFDRAETRDQQIWLTKDNPYYSHLAIGYDREGKVRYATALAENKEGKKRLRFTEFGDITQARAESVPPHYRYIWELPATDQKSAMTLIIYGDNPDYLSFFSLSKKTEAKVGSEGEED